MDRFIKTLDSYGLKAMEVKIPYSDENELKTIKNLLKPNEFMWGAESIIASMLETQITIVVKDKKRFATKFGLFRKYGKLSLNFYGEICLDWSEEGKFIVAKFNDTYHFRQNLSRDLRENEGEYDVEYPGYKLKKMFDKIKAEEEMLTWIESMWHKVRRDGSQSKALEELHKELVEIVEKIQVEQVKAR